MAKKIVVAEKPAKLVPPAPVADVTPERIQSSAAPTPVADEVEVDYLRKYQYRKQTNFGSPESDPRVGTKAEAMKKHLLAQPRVRVMIPRDPNEDASIKQSVTLNGYRLDLPKQTYVVVPEQVADVLMESLNQTEAAIGRQRIDGNKSKEAALL